MRKRLVVGNWKLHGSLSQNAILLELIKQGVHGVKCEVAVCPPYPYLSQVRELLAGSEVALGAQSVSEHAMGAFTGEVAATMLKEVGCRYVLVGHSERRSLFGETDDVVAAKFKAAHLAGLMPVLCVGESLAERESGRTLSVVAGQLAAIIDCAGVAALASSVIAYEPVWAIGTGITATPHQVQEVHAAIRERIGVEDASLAAGVRILYGGSVKPQNARELFEQPDVDGGLVGGAALVADDFLAICRSTT